MPGVTADLGQSAIGGLAVEPVRNERIVGEGLSSQAIVILTANLLTIKSVWNERIVSERIRSVVASAGVDAPSGVARSPNIVTADNV